MSNHLGNVLEVVSDRKLPVNDGNGNIDYFLADVVSYSDYYPYGMQMPGRSFQSDEYRYGFNSMEKDDEIKGESNSYTTHFRQYDPRVGRWLSLDPAQSDLPWQSPYVSFNNSPIQFTDTDGDYIDWNVKGKKKRKIKRYLRKMKRSDKRFRKTWRTWRQSDDKHTIWAIAHTNTNREREGGATQNNQYPFIYTNSAHEVKNRKGEKVVNHHHYIGTPNFSTEEKDFEVDFKSGSNEVISGSTSPIQEYIDDNNVTGVEISLGTTAHKKDAQEKSKNTGITLDGEIVRNKSINDLLNAREQEIVQDINYEGSIKSERVYAGQQGREGGVDKVKSVVTVKTINYDN